MRVVRDEPREHAPTLHVEHLGAGRYRHLGRWPHRAERLALDDQRRILDGRAPIALLRGEKEHHPSQGWRAPAARLALV
ncbi:hypothetical protein [Myxococcus sp. AB025B]|uniref:hypothetical protein n=1 Tax=Myxococcus TaxID=32 RepID=UPI001E54D0B9|nr:hypothetical protein [Myxococcus sp. AB025B]